MDKRTTKETKDSIFSGLNREALTDLRTIKADPALSPEYRLARYVDETGDHRVFKYGDSLVMLAWDDSRSAIQDNIAELLSSQCQ